MNNQTTENLIPSEFTYAAEKVFDAILPQVVALKMTIRDENDRTAYEKVGDNDTHEPTGRIHSVTVFLSTPYGTDYALVFGMELSQDLRPKRMRTIVFNACRYYMQYIGTPYM